MRSIRKVSSEEFVDFEVEVSPEHAGVRLDSLITRLLKELTEAEGTLPNTGVVPSRSKVAAWIAEGYVRVNFAPCLRASAVPPVGALITVSIPPPPALFLKPDPQVTFEIVHEDADLLVINKPAALVVHPGAGQYEGTLVHGLLAHLGEQHLTVGNALRPGIVHRLDKDTSGLMVVGKTEPAYQALVRQFLPPRTIERTYHAFTLRLPQGGVADGVSTTGVIDAPIGRHPHDRTKMAVTAQGGREARTNWKLHEQFARGLELEVKLVTGRTHQIRVHLAYKNAPLIGDLLYGPGLAAYPPELRRAVKALDRQALHAGALSFIHPRSQTRVSFTAPLPDDLALLRQALTSA